MANQLLIGTNNPSKFNEITAILSDLNIKFIKPENLNITDQPDETEETLEQNALLKAKFFANKTGLITLADDSGLEIDALNDAPGIYVRRWPSRDRGDKILVDATDQELIDFTLEKMKNVPLAKRGAQFHGVVCIYNPNTNEHFFFNGIIRGIIAPTATPTHEPKYPLDALFYFPDQEKYLQQMPLDMRQNVSHRSIAVREARDKIKELFNL